MTRPRPGALAIAGALALFASAGPTPAFADRPTPTQSIAPPSPEARFPVAGRSDLRRGAAGPAAGGPGGWWVGSAGIAAALAVVGGVSLASKRFLPSRDLGPIQVVGRASLSPRLSVFLVRVGDRVLILGTGAQGPPSALGEVTDPAELARLAPRRSPRPDDRRPATGIDRRIGGDE